LLRLLKVRNPWGSGAGNEWTGRFCDEDEAWDEYKLLREKLNYSFKMDGNWWMDWIEWKANYNRVYVCKLFPSSWA
jgi:calpain-3/calpain